MLDLYLSCNLLKEPRYSYWEGRQNSLIFGDCSYLVLDHLQYLCYSFVKSALACQPSFFPPFQQYFMWRKPYSGSAIFLLWAQTKFVCWVVIGCTPYIREQIRACMFKAEPRSFLRLLVRPVAYCRLRFRWRWTRCRCSPRSGPTGSPYSSPSSSHSAASPPSLSA